jgi:hypothetical protein
MVHQTDIFAFKAKVYNLKHRLEQDNLTETQKNLINTYLNEVLFYVEQLK